MHIKNKATNSVQCKKCHHDTNKKRPSVDNIEEIVRKYNRNKQAEQNSKIKREGVNSICNTGKYGSSEQTTQYAHI